MCQDNSEKTQTEDQNNKKRDGKTRRFLPLYILAGVIFLYAVVRLGAGLINDARNARDNAKLRESVDVVSTPSDAAETSGSPTPEIVPISADFAELKSNNPDICGWLYSPDTYIDYPVVQGSDNSYYLTHTADNNVNDNGALFVDARGAGDFSDKVNVIYGHNLENQNMFGSLSEYYSQEYYQKHPVMYLLTPDANYRLDICCTFVTYVTSPIFTFPATESSYGLLLKDIENYNYINPTVTAVDGDRLVCMSTCSVSDDQRFMVIAKMTQMD